jgi:hypothetical protein
MKLGRWLGLPVLLLLTMSLKASDVQSGPAVGDKVAPLKVFDATGAHKDKEVDYAAERKDKPTVYLFVNEWNRPTARFLRTLDEALREDGDKAYAVAVWLTDNVDMMKDHLPRVQQSIQLQRTAMTVFLGDKKGPDGWGLNDMAHLTVVVAGKHNKVAATFALVSVNETDVRKVRMAVKKVITE